MSESAWSRRDFLRGRAPAGLLGSTAGPRAEARPIVGATTQRSVALLDPRRCLGAASQVCTVCIERCTPYGAIRLRGLMPQVDHARCTGCGLCVEACPAPETALRLGAQEEARR